MYYEKWRHVRSVHDPSVSSIVSRLNEPQKDALAGQLQRMHELLSPGGSNSLDNGSLLNTMFDIVEREVSGRATSAAPASLSPSTMRNSGKALP